jgi:hypothetical protein
VGFGWIKARQGKARQGKAGKVKMMHDFSKEDSHTDRAHSVFAPSSSHRWFNCPGSIALSANIVGVTSSFAKEGTSVHQLISECLTTGENAVVHVGRIIQVEGEDFLIDEYACECAQTFLDYVRAKVREGYQLQVEVKLDLSHLAADQFGHGDAVLYHPESFDLIIADYKHGRGIVVDVNENPQLLSYGSGARRMHGGARSLTLVVVQPRAGNPAVREWKTSIARLYGFEDEFRNAVARAQAPDAPLIPGGWCQFCSALGICPAIRSKSLEVARAEFAVMNEPPPLRVLSDDELGMILDQATMIEHWIEAVRKEGLQRAFANRLPTGWKMVRRRTLRRWKDESAVEAALVDILDMNPDQIWQHRLLSPAQIEKMLGKDSADMIAPLIEKPLGEPTLAPLDDKREAIKLDPKAEGFEKVTQQLKDSIKLLSSETGE